MAIISANQVADFYIKLTQEHGDYISQLKLQKIIYYADAWYMVNHHGQSLIQEDFEAWIHGPVIRSIYQRFKSYGWQPILEAVNWPDLNDEIKEHLIEVYEVFGSFSAFDLERMTHEELPWREAREGCAPDDACENFINKNTMYEFYTKVAQES